MKLTVSTQLSLYADNQADCLLQFDAASLPDQNIDIHTRTLSEPDAVQFAAQDHIGQRLWARFAGEFDIEYEFTATIDRMIPALAECNTLSPGDLPREAVPYLFDSRYCAASRFQSFALNAFGDRTGGDKVRAICDWVADNVSYQPGVSDASTGADDTFLERRGICRDFAHLVVALSRACAIPARFVSCYAPDVEPQDFHAVAEVFLADPTRDDGGFWHLVDATGMAAPENIVKIGVGRDAADVSFLTAFGNVSLNHKEISVTRAD